MGKTGIDLGMLIATALMATFALFSLVTTIIQAKSQNSLLKKQQKSQENLLNKQNEIQQKHLQLALLKEKQEIREDFRNLIITQRKKMEDIIYHCEKMGIGEFRSHMSKSYVIIMRMRDLFGRQFEFDAKKIINNYENILSWQTNRISELRLFENGLVHYDREVRLSESELKEYKKVHHKNVHWLLESDEFFSNILERMAEDIDKIAKEFQNAPPGNKGELEMEEIMERHWLEERKFRARTQKFLCRITFGLSEKIILKYNPKLKK